MIPPNSKNIEIFLEPLLEEFTTPFDVVDAVDGLTHPCFPVLLFGVFDLKALPKATCGQPAPAKYACHECDFKSEVSCGPVAGISAPAILPKKMMFDSVPVIALFPTLMKMPDGSLVLFVISGSISLSSTVLVPTCTSLKLKCWSCPNLPPSMSSSSLPMSFRCPWLL